jgi:hypothetical protein
MFFLDFTTSVLIYTYAKKIIAHINCTFVGTGTQIHVAVFTNRSKVITKQL